MFVHPFLLEGKMKTYDILNLDCTKQENIKTLNRFLWKIKPIARMLEKEQCTKTQMIPLELLEKALHGFCIRYGYFHQGFHTYYEYEKQEDGTRTNKKFVFYHASVITPDRQWIGEVYGKTLWEITAKTIIKIYAHIKAEES